MLADPKYTRAWPGGVGNRKMGSNYAPTINVQKEASKKGLQQVLWLYGDDHQLTEVGTMNIFMFHINEQGEKELVTPPLDGLILPGITRDSILALGRQWGQFKVTERKFTMPEVLKLLEKGRVGLYDYIAFKQVSYCIFSHSYWNFSVPAQLAWSVPSTGSST